MEVTKDIPIKAIASLEFYRINTFYFSRAVFLIQDCRTRDPVSSVSFRGGYFTCTYSIQDFDTEMLPQSMPVHLVPFPEDLMQYLRRDIARVILEVSLVTTADISNSKFKTTALCITLKWQTAFYQLG